MRALSLLCPVFSPFVIHSPTRGLRDRGAFKVESIKGKCPKSPLSPPQLLPSALLLTPTYIGSTVSNLSTKTAPILFTMDQGVAQFAAVWRAFSSQWTQPQILKMWAEYLGTRALHSSQIDSLKRQNLTEPGPKMFLAIGYVNCALARSNNHPEHLIEKVTDIGYAPKLPGTLEHLWLHRKPLLDAQGVAMGPTGVFEAFCGLRDLPSSNRPSLTGTEAEIACRAIGTYLRMQLPKLGIDWYSQLHELSKQCPTVHPLLMGDLINGDRLAQDLPDLAQLSGTSTESLWGTIENAIAHHSP
jgi:hypothetical protein